MAAEVSFYRKFRRKFKSHMSLYPNLSLPSKKAADFVLSTKIQRNISQNDPKTFFLMLIWFTLKCTAQQLRAARLAKLHPA